MGGAASRQVAGYRTRRRNHHHDGAVGDGIRVRYAVQQTRYKSREPQRGNCAGADSRNRHGQSHKTVDKTVAGWTEILGLLKIELETGKLPFKTRVMYRLMGLFQFALPKTTSLGYADKQGW